MRLYWTKLLCPRRVGEYGPPGEGAGARAAQQGTVSQDLRSEFEKDYHRIIGSSSFRRLQDKTQVFALDKSDFIRTRLTHSLEVSSFSKSLGQNIAQYLLDSRADPDFTVQTKTDICDILMCAGLIHDIGNPPFGHFGEEAIRDWFRRRMRLLKFGTKPVSEILSPQMLGDLIHFEGNAQALRQVTKLHFLVNENGMNLTFALLNTIIKYPVPSTGIHPESGKLSEKKMGFFYAERRIYEQISAATGAVGVRHPLTFILEAADDIAYRTADIEDAFKKGCLSYDILVRELKAAMEEAKNQHLTVDLEHLDPIAMLDRQYQKAVAMGLSNPGFYAAQNFLVRLQSTLLYCATYGFTSNYWQIMNGSYEHDLFYRTYGDWVIRALGVIAFRYAFHTKPILSMEVSAFTILNFLMDRFVPAVVNYDSHEPMGMMEGKMVDLISENYRQIYHVYSRSCSEAEKLYLRLLLVTDFISGMTDTYAKDLYQKLNGIS